MNSNRDYATENINLKKRLEVLESNSDKVIKDSVALMNKNLELQSRIEELEKDLQEEMNNYQEMGRLWHKSETRNEQLIKAVKDEIEFLRERRFTAYACDDYVVHGVLNTIIEELEGILYGIDGSI